MWSSSPYGSLNWRGLYPIKLVCDQNQPDTWLNLKASNLNQLGHYASGLGRRGYCYAELAVFFPSGGRNHVQYTFCLVGCQAELAWLHSEMVYLPKG